MYFKRLESKAEYVSKIEDAHRVTTEAEADFWVGFLNKLGERNLKTEPHADGFVIRKAL